MVKFKTKQWKRQIKTFKTKHIIMESQLILDSKELDEHPCTSRQNRK